VVGDPGAPTDQEFTVLGFAAVPAVAVLPFDDLSEDGGQQYFADGLAEDLITRLSGYRWFPVIARNSSFTYRGQVDVKQVSRELGVRYVVEGSVRRAGDRVRISAQLIDATTGHHVWAKTYDRELGDIFAVQDELTEEITASMSPELVRSESARALRREPRNLDAFEFLARGRWHLFRWTRDDNVRARSYFERALDLDPQLAVAFSEIAWTHYYDIMNGWTDSPTRSITALERAARSCLAVDELFAGCYLGMGYFYLTTGKQDMAIAALERSVQLNPNLADVYGALGMALAVAGRSDEAMSSLEKAMRLSPQDPWMGFYLVSAGWAQFAAERYEDAVGWSERALQSSPGDRDIATFAHRMLAASYAQLGRLDEAREALAEELRLEPDLTLEKVRSQNPTTDPDFLERWLDGLRKAGLKE
jgi:TolB-like protein/Tfp pilus assembly protein PilF